MLRHSKTTSTSIWWTGPPRTCWQLAWAPACTCGRRQLPRYPQALPQDANSLTGSFLSYLELHIKEDNTIALLDMMPQLQGNLDPKCAVCGLGGQK